MIATQPNMLASSKARVFLVIGALLASLCLMGTSALASSGDREVAAYAMTQNGKTLGVIRFYSRASGNSGFYRVTNQTNRDLRYTLTIRNGRGQTRRISVPVDAGKTTGGASYASAGTNKSGVAGITVRNISAR